MKILAHSKDTRGNGLITYQFEISIYLLLELLKFKQMEVTWSLLEIGGFDRRFTTTLTSSKPALFEFFEKCCPKYDYNLPNNVGYKSWKDALNHSREMAKSTKFEYQINKEDLQSDKENFNQNKTTDIHLQEIAEQMYDLYNESEAIELKEGEWHIPFKDEMSSEKSISLAHSIITKGNREYAPDVHELNETIKEFIPKLSVALISNQNETDYKNLIRTYDQLVKDNELDTFVHCARVMTEREYYLNIKGRVDEATLNFYRVPRGYFNETAIGWCDNYKGFVSYRYIVQTKTF